MDPASASAIPVARRLGRLPALWGRPVLFFADLYAIFYGEPEKTAQLKGSVSGFFGYGGRLVPMLDLLYAGGANTLVLQQAPEPATLDYYRALGLALPEIVVLDHREFATFHDALARRPDLVADLAARAPQVIDGYVTDPALEEMARRLGKRVVNGFAESRAANDKLALFRFLRAAGLPVFDGGDTAPDRLDGVLADLEARGYRRAVVRSAWGASGFGVAVIDLAGHAPALPHHLTVEDRVLVQGWVAPGILGIGAVSSPSVQFFVGDGGITLFDLTGQLLRDASIHEGNVSPPVCLLAEQAEADTVAELLRQSEAVTRWVASTGYRGTGSIDFLVYPQDGAVQVRVCEVNARVTGATYPSLLARRLRPDGAWLMRNFGFSGGMVAAGMLERLDRAGLLFTGARDGGVLPINVIADDSGPGPGPVVKSQLLFLADTPDACADMMERTLAATGTGHHERD